MLSIGGWGALIRHGGTGNEVLHVHPVMRHPLLPPRRPLEIRHCVAGGRLAVGGGGNETREMAAIYRPAN